MNIFIKMNKTKIQLSAKEMRLVTNADIILTKNAIIKKTITLLEKVQHEQQDYLSKASQLLPQEVLDYSPKISKGENYKGLPYLVLDHPRIFDKPNVFAIRTMFWWGNFFSVTLHLSGRYKLLFEKNIINSYEALKDSGFAVCVNKEEWEHHFEENNYRTLSQIKQTEFKKSILEAVFVKLAKKISLQDWDKVPDILIADFRKIIEMIT